MTEVGRLLWGSTWVALGVGAACLIYSAGDILFSGQHRQLDWTMMSAGAILILLGVVFGISASSVPHKNPV